jgi:hypothetical protein
MDVGENLEAETDFSKVIASEENCPVFFKSDAGELADEKVQHSLYFDNPSQF